MSLLCLELCSDSSLGLKTMVHTKSFQAFCDPALTYVLPASISSLPSITLASVLFLKNPRQIHLQALELDFLPSQNTLPQTTVELIPADPSKLCSGLIFTMWSPFKCVCLSLQCPYPSPSPPTLPCST